MSTTPHHPVRYLVLWLTTACNLRCTYCYRGDPSTRSMSLEVARTALDLAASSGLEFHVQMAGGEPTLEPQLMEAIARIVREAGWPASLAVQTNGTLMDRHLIDICRRYSISVGVSLDGPPEVHERTRGSTGATFRGLGLLARAGIPVHVTTVLSSINAMELGRLILTLACFTNVQGFALDPVVLKGNALGRCAIAPSEEALVLGVRTMLRTLGEVNRLRSKPIRWREQDSVSNALKGGGKRRDYCHACRGESLAVHPSGTVYPCGQAVSDPAMEAGTVEHVDWERLSDIFRGTRLQGDCLKCFLVGRCPGDCPSRIHYNGKHTKDQSMCLIYRTIAESIIQTSPCTGQPNRNP